MKKAIITNVRFVRTKETHERGVVLDVKGYAKSIYRNEKQFLSDLKGSFRLSDDVVDLNDSAVLNVLPHLRGKEVEGNFIYRLVGDTYEANEFSTAVKNGKAKVGQQIAVEKEGFYVEGFLMIPKTQEELLFANVASDAGKALAKLLTGMSSGLNAMATQAIDIETETEEIADLALGE